MCRIDHTRQTNNPNGNSNSGGTAESAGGHTTANNDVASAPLAKHTQQHAAAYSSQRTSFLQHQSTLGRLATLALDRM